MENKSIDCQYFQGLKPAVVSRVTDVIRPYPHQVISQQILFRDNCSVSWFYFDCDEGISTDIQHQDILYIVAEGTGLFTVDKVENRMTQGEGILVPAGHPHSICAVSAMWMLQISIGELTPENHKNGGYNMEQRDFIKNIEKAKVKALAELVAYQPGKVASLTLVQKDFFTTTLMAMDRGTGVGPHICEGDALVVALDGEGDVMIDSDHFAVRKGECIVMPAGIPHAVRGGKESFKMMLIVSKPEN